MRSNLKSWLLGVATWIAIASFALVFVVPEKAIAGWEESLGGGFMPLIIKVLVTIGFGVYLYLIGNRNTMRTLYKNGVGALLSHVGALVFFAFVCACWFGETGLIGALIVVMVIVLMSLITGTGIVTVNERTARFIMLFGEPLCMVWMYKQYVELESALVTNSKDYAEGMIEGTIIKASELYTNPGCHDGTKVLQQQQTTTDTLSSRTDAVYFKRHITQRMLRSNFLVQREESDLTAGQIDKLSRLEEKLKDALKQSSEPERPEIAKQLREIFSFPRMLTRKQVFMQLDGHELDCETIQHCVEISQVEFEAASTPEKIRIQAQRQLVSTGAGVPLNTLKKIGKNFWAFAGDFYFYPLEGDAYKHFRINLNNDVVINKVVGDQGVGARIRNVNHGDAGLWGSLVYVGPWPFFRLYSYSMRWQSPDDEKLRAVENLTHINLDDDIYVVTLHEAEDKDQVRLTFKLYVKLRIVNPYNALFKIQRWLENVSAITEANYRKMVGTAEFEEIYRSRNEFGQGWWKLFQATIADDKGEHLERRYGVRVLVVEISKVDIIDVDAKKLQEAEYKAKREKQKVLVDANAEKQRIETVYDTILSRGDRGMLIKLFETLDKAGKGPGNWIIPFGSIDSLLSGYMKKGDKESGLTALAKLGEAAGMTPEQILEIWKEIEKKKGVVS